MKTNINIIIAIAMLTLVGCASDHSTPEGFTITRQAEDIDAIKQLNDDWKAGWLTGDFELLLSLYADEPILMPQDQPIVVGKDSIRPLYQAVLEAVSFKSQGIVEEIEVSGDLGYFRTSYTFSATPKAGGEAIEVTGKTIFIVKRQHDGTWKITHLMDNSDGETSNNQ